MAARRLGYPEDIDEWPLETGTKIHDVVARKREAAQKETIVCPKCHAVREFGGVCVSCGYQYQPKPKSVEAADGTLEALTREQALCALANQGSSPLADIAVVSGGGETPQADPVASFSFDSIHEKAMAYGSDTPAAPEQVAEPVAD